MSAIGSVGSAASFAPTQAVRQPPPQPSAAPTDGDGDHDGSPAASSATGGSGKLNVLA